MTCDRGVNARMPPDQTPHYKRLHFIKLAVGTRAVTYKAHQVWSQFIKLLGSLYWAQLNFH